MKKVYWPAVCLNLIWLVAFSGCSKDDIIDLFKNKSIVWKVLPGQATDISVGGNGTIHITGVEEISSTGGYSISKWSNNEWVLIPGAAVRIAVDPSGDPWVVNKSGLIFKREGETWPWHVLPRYATDIGIGADGSVYITDKTNISEEGGFGIHKWSGFGWEQISGEGVRIAVDSSGNPWVINNAGSILRYSKSSSTWEPLPGKATDIGIGADGSVYITGNILVSEDGGYEIYKWTGNRWKKLSGSAVNVSVSPTGKPYFVNKLGVIFTSK